METAVEFLVQEDETAEIVLSPRPASDGHLVKGRILDEGGEPIRTSVNINGRLQPGDPPSGKGCGSDAEGYFQMEGVSSGRMLAVFWRLGYLQEFAVEGIEKVVDLGTLRVPKLTGTLAIRGRVSDDQDVSLRGTKVCLARDRDVSGWVRFVTTDGSGRFSFDRVSPGRYRIWHEASARTNFVERSQPETVLVEDRDVEHDLNLVRIRE
jgi:hypothetical protein